MNDELNMHQLTGLTEPEVAERLTQEGYNELPSTKARSIWAIALEVVREPMFLLLLACGTLYLILGDVEEAMMLLGFVFIVMGITLYQERKTERALEALRDLSSPRALVIRNGEQKRIAGREVVRDDIILLSEGDRVPADATLLSATNLNADESLLTGESVSVRKTTWDGKLELAQPGGDDLPFVYSGTMVVKGQAIARVSSTGSRTEIGKIGKALQSLEPEETSLQRQTEKIVRNFSIVGFGMFVFVVVVYGVTRGDWLNGFLAGIALAMATLPEEFPVVLTIFLALGAWRISQHNVLTRRVPAVETLGAATVLCTDKTGTLTFNRMTVTQFNLNGEISHVTGKQTTLPENIHPLVEFSILASPADPFDPMEKAMKELGERTLANTEHLHHDWTLLREYPLSEKLLAMSRVWRSPDEQKYVIASKGAPEAIADLCHFKPAQLKVLEQQIKGMASQGLRVIGVARSYFQSTHLPPDQHDFTFEFLGLLGLSDPVRPEILGAVQECYTAGVRVIMITGDYPETAKNIAGQIGLRNHEEIITGPELAKLNDAELQQRIKTVNIFARAVPEHKLRLVNALKANGEIVAMTGDGVNDAPALKAAHIGIAMGGRGTDVARESAALVLLDDNFSSIVQAVKMGRRIFDNLKKAMAFIFSVHIPIAGMSLLPVLFKWPLALLPVHIVFLELIIDPSCSVVFEMESEEEGIMNRPPRTLDDPLFGLHTIIISLIQGLGVLGVVLAIYALGLSRVGELEARMLAFTTLIIANIGLIMTNRSWTRSIISTLRIPNSALWWVSGGAIFFLILVLEEPFLRELFRFAAVTPMDLVISVSAGLFTIFISESLKFKPIQRWLSQYK